MKTIPMKFIYYIYIYLGIFPIFWTKIEGINIINKVTNVKFSNQIIWHRRGVSEKRNGPLATEDKHRPAYVIMCIVELCGLSWPVPCLFTTQNDVWFISEVRNVHNMYSGSQTNWGKPIWTSKARPTAWYVGTCGPADSGPGNQIWPHIRPPA